METKEIISTSIPLPSSNSHDQKNIDCSNQKLDKAMIEKGSLTLSFDCSASKKSNLKPLVSPDSRSEGPPMDAVAIRALTSIISDDYIGRYIKDDFFRKTIFEKCNSYLVRRRKNGSESDKENEILVNMKLSMKNIDKLVDDQKGTTKKDLRIKCLKNSIDLLTIIVSLNSNRLQDATTCGIPNSHLCACGELYMAIVYKLQNNNRVCARHLMQVFYDAPFFARTYLVPEFWEHLFLPQLLHLRIWYTEEVETISDSNESDGEKEKKMKYLRRVYNDKLDIGTVMFAVYYKQWLKVGTKEPPLPVVSLPSRP
ncbi:hypothetical protein L195_g026176 [Trifolium pratense]|uniref:Putative E3 ubiquitin-protein ligase LIN N-terminal domain-containing protein n=1 Tax=Trifolium pratense TaxID=57577 RepID=A0A2K3NII4_TRIPR|nr:hypothetical protein L195_g026176 [Trifolium pratense]